jgi:hypothetical protein
MPVPALPGPAPPRPGCFPVAFMMVARRGYFGFGTDFGASRPASVVPPDDSEGRLGSATVRRLHSQREQCGELVTRRLELAQVSLAQAAWFASIVPRPGNPRPGESGPRFPFPAESGIGDSLPDSRPNRESGKRELGISGSDCAALDLVHPVHPATE